MVLCISGSPNWAEALGAIVGLVGTAFLILNLQEQKKLTKIQQDDFRLKFLPIIETVDKNVFADGDNRRISFGIKITRNPMAFLDWTCEHHPLMRFIDIDEKPGHTLQIGDIESFIFDYSWHGLLQLADHGNPIPIHLLKAFIKITFTDFLGNNYHQTIHIINEDIKLGNIIHIGKNS